MLRRVTDRGGCLKTLQAALLGLLLLAAGGSEPVLGGICFENFYSPMTISKQMIWTNGVWLWEARVIGAVLFIPIPGTTSCGDTNAICSLTNVTVAGGVLLSSTIQPSTISPNGSLAVLDCVLLQTPGATRAEVVIDSPCFSSTNSLEFSELVGMTAGLSDDLSSPVRLCWNTRTNTTYQVQSTTDVTTNAWTNLGDTVPGNGTTACITDAVVPSGRFYRVMTVP